MKRVDYILLDLEGLWLTANAPQVRGLNDGKGYATAADALEALLAVDDASVGCLDLVRRTRLSGGKMPALTFTRLSLAELVAAGHILCNQRKIDELFEKLKVPDEDYEVRLAEKLAKGRF